MRDEGGRVSCVCSICLISNANRKSKQIVFIYRLFRCLGQQTNKKGTNIWPMPPTPQSMQNSSTSNTFTYVCLYVRVCARVMMTIVQKTFYRNTQKRAKQSGKPKDNKCCRQILSTSRLLSHCCCGCSSFLLLLLLLLLSSLLPDPFIIFAMLSLSLV